MTGYGGYGRYKRDTVQISSDIAKICVRLELLAGGGAQTAEGQTYWGASRKCGEQHRHRDGAGGPWQVVHLVCKASVSVGAVPDQAMKGRAKAQHIDQPR